MQNTSKHIICPPLLRQTIGDEAHVEQRAMHLSQHFHGLSRCCALWGAHILEGDNIPAQRKMVMTFMSVTAFLQKQTW